MRAPDHPSAPVGQPLGLNWRAAAWMIVAIVVSVFILANAHLIYVAFQSQPGCAPGQGTAGGQTAYRAANPAC